MTTNNIFTRPLSAMPYAQASVTCHCDGSLTLRSYRTDVIHITTGGWLIINGLYSMTTRKHIGAFMREYAKADFQLAKRLHTDGLMYNIYTGEVRRR